MRFLSFPERTEETVREMQWEQRSLVPLSAAALVAANVRERLQGALGAVEVRLFAPRMPDEDGWTALRAGARIDGVRGPLGIAAFITRPEELRSLVGLAFGVAIPSGRALSAVETQVFERFLRLIAPALAPLCGGGAAPEAMEERRFSSYFELLVESGACGRLGIALESEPQPGAPHAAPIERIAHIELALHARAECAQMRAGEIAAWAPGALVPLRRNEITLVADGEALARGELGVRNNHFAVAIARGATTSND
ncbi:MAG: FliM/FliN family flagellar motor C-terminal domain-containing protein [Candidatus Eremiobacteraeota bacterium]|nr:FliM/FliN family flagellar motor C-terminal domain-containing protein [Candidatus Eremiobacteraeota bacterium]